MNTIHSKSLINIEPYNELFFESCFYNSFFSVINYYNKSIIPFLLNSVPVYTYDCNDDGFFSLKYMKVLNMGEMITKVGIKFFSKCNNMDIIKNIVTSINEDKPIIVKVDCFYMPIRTEYYLKLHWEHLILIYGYDNMKQTFNIIEQKHIDSLTYNKTEIKYDDLVNAYEGYLNLSIKNPMEDSYIEYELDKNYNFINNKSNDYINVFKQNISFKLEDINKGLKLLEKLILNFEMIFMDENILKENINYLVSGLNSIINGKKVEKYKLEKILGKEDILLNLTTKIENN